MVLSNLSINVIDVILRMVGMLSVGIMGIKVVFLIMIMIIL